MTGRDEHDDPAGAPTEPTRAPLHGTEGVRDVHAQPAQGRANVGPARHVWVATVDGTVPGLLTKWQTNENGWRGRVLYQQRGKPGSSAWVTVADWVPARLLEPA